MDLSLLPSLGAAGALVVVIGYLLASNRADRAQQREAMDAALTRIARLEKDVVELNTQLDRERALRRDAEDAAATARREVADLSARLDRLSARGPDGHQ